MNYQKEYLSVFERYGSKVQIHKDGADMPVKAFVRPLRYKNKLYLEGKVGPAGIADRNLFLYMGPCDVNPGTAETGDYVLFRGYKYTPLKCELIELTGQPLYYWAILQKMEGEIGA